MKASAPNENTQANAVNIKERNSQFQIYNLKLRTKKKKLNSNNAVNQVRS